ncbi:hypothetical protein [Micromonospora cremea]|uniref:Uncharacterized protein n=1 Tax=Micromonospora cremea TaxID=709881 RepID=A0A1N6AJ46_9ACTN|nr:hypothetical protein [Micromonospora cremea]SIN33974.1 hypothetical protein SAMN04489832_5614 [Micromonospora cremea]
MSLHARTVCRAAARLAVAVLILGGLTSCSPERKGITGLTVDAAGRPLAALAWCSDRPPDIVSLFTVREATSPTPSGRPTPWPMWPGEKYTVPRAATSPTTVPLESFPPGSGADPDVAYAMYGVADDNSFTTHRVDFRVGELTDLAAGSVLVTEIVEGEEVQVTLSLEEFAHRGENEC